MTQRNPTRMLAPPPSPYRPQPRGLKALLIGMAFGLGAGILLTIGILTLISANSTSQTTSPIANGGATSQGAPTSLPTLAPTPTQQPPTPTPTSAPSPAPTARPTSGNGGGQLLAPDDPRFYLVGLLVFVLLAGIYLARKK